MIKLALDDSVSPEDISRLAADLAWLFVDKIPSCSDNATEIIWVAQEQQTEIHFVMDEHIGSHYLAFIGPSEEVVSAQARQRIKLFDLDEVLAKIDVETAREQQIALAAYLGVLAPKTYEPRSLFAIEKLLSSLYPSVRQLAVLTAAYYGWPELLPLLNKVKNEDPEDFVRWRAEVALKAFDQVFLGR